MRKQNRLIAGLCLLAMMLSLLVGCGESAAGKDSGKAEEPAKETAPAANEPFKPANDGNLHLFFDDGTEIMKNGKVVMLPGTSHELIVTDTDGNYITRDDFNHLLWEFSDLESVAHVRANKSSDGIYSYYLRTTDRTGLAKIKLTWSVDGSDSQGFSFYVYSTNDIFNGSDYMILLENEKLPQKGDQETAELKSEKPQTFEEAEALKEKFWKMDAADQANAEGEQDHIYKQIQLYRLEEREYKKNGTTEKAYTYKDGICNFSSYITLLNRYVACYYDDYRYPAVAPETVMEQYNSKDPYREPYPYYFYKASADNYGNYSENVTIGGTTYKALLPYDGDTICKCTGVIMNHGMPLPTEAFKYRHDNGRTIQTKIIKITNSNKAEYQDPKKFAELLTEHPEGIYVHAKHTVIKNGKETKEEHAVVITKYSLTSDGTYTFTVIDPARVPSFDLNQTKGQGPRIYQTKYSKKDGYQIMDTHKLKLSEVDTIAYLWEKTK